MSWMLRRLNAPKFWCSMNEKSSSLKEMASIHSSDSYFPPWPFPDHQRWSHSSRLDHEWANDQLDCPLVAGCTIAYQTSRREWSRPSKTLKWDKSELTAELCSRLGGKVFGWKLYTMALLPGRYCADAHCHYTTSALLSLPLDAGSVEEKGTQIDWMYNVLFVTAVRACKDLLKFLIYWNLCGKCFSGHRHLFVGAVIHKEKKKITACCLFFMPLLQQTTLADKPTWGEE